MRVLGELDYFDYRADWDNEIRIASRAIIKCNERIVLIKSDKFGDFKFPGGGVKITESLFDALIRETREETGLEVDLNTIREYGVMMEKRRMFDENKILYQVSYYFECGITNNVGPVSLDAFEKELGYRLVCEKPITAINQNNENLDNPYTPWVRRESLILSLLINK